jgi:flavin-dependent dehydrogenase
VSALFYQSAFRRDGITHLLNAIPELRARAAHIEQTTPLLACAPLGLRVARLMDEELLLIGDAAGAPDPITGDGMAMAIVSAKPAAEAILSRDFRAYEQTRLQMGRTADRLGRLLLGIPRADGRAARMLLRRRALVPTLLDVAVGRRALNAATMLRAVCNG